MSNKPTEDVYKVDSQKYIINTYQNGKQKAKKKDQIG